MQDEHDRKWADIEGMLQGLSKAPAPTFGPFFPNRVMRKIEEMEKSESSLEGIYHGLFAAFSRIGLAGIAMILLLFIWMRIQPNGEMETRTVEQTLEQEIESANYQNLEELI